MTVWFTSDTHFSHTNIIKYCNRPFSSVVEMNETLVDNWNRVVKKGDVVYHLGDVSMHMNNEQFCQLFSRLHGTKKLVLGNHDRHINKTTLLKCFAKVEHMMSDTVDGTYVIMCHYPLRAWDKQHYGSLCLHGHVHGKLDNCSLKNSIDVGTDSWNFTPCNIDQIRERLTSRKCLESLVE